MDSQRACSERSGEGSFGKGRIVSACLIPTSSNASGKPSPGAAWLPAAAEFGAPPLLIS